VGMAGEGRRRIWRWAVAVWAVMVAVAGRLTLWPQDSAQPRGPYSWDSTANPSLPEGWQTLRPSPTAGEADGSVVRLCVVSGR
jgi:hypothetical protein